MFTYACADATPHQLVSAVHKLSTGFMTTGVRLPTLSLQKEVTSFSRGIPANRYSLDLGFRHLDPLILKETPDLIYLD
ncbi:hypothetical protein J6590_009385 [Homalodisca vitripennis]|nr:hypothetical protein J6590_009385 [Homalodisca vitripennis]